MIKLNLPVIVEGKYDKIKLSSFLDGVIITTDGFGIFKNKDKVSLIKKLAKEKGIVVLTDSDSAGNIIRSYLKNIIGDDKIFNVVLPSVKGKEKRKTKPSSEGFLGVEGIEKQEILNSFNRFAPFAIGQESAVTQRNTISTAFLMSQGLTGCCDSVQRRKFLLKKLGLPESVSPSTLKKLLGQISSEAEIKDIIKEYKKML